MRLAKQTLQTIKLAPKHTRIQTARRRHPPPHEPAPSLMPRAPTWGGVGWDVGEVVEGTALQMLLEIQHVPHPSLSHFPFHFP